MALLSGAPASLNVSGGTSPVSQCGVAGVAGGAGRSRADVTMSEIPGCELGGCAWWTYLPAIVRE
jgi:hypothetical protein